jgi:peptide/nickel transport system permease protein
LGIYILRRLLITIPLLFAMTFIIFMIIQIAPGDFFDQWALQPDINQRQLRQWKREFGADKSWLTQYLMWLRGVLLDVRFTSEREWIAAFEFGDKSGPSQRENRSAFEVSGTASSYFFTRRENDSFALAFQFDDPHQTGIISKWHNADEASQNAYNQWSGEMFQALEMDLRVLKFDGADLFLRIADADKKVMVERHFISEHGATITLSDDDYARYEVSRDRIQPINLFLTQNTGPPTPATIRFFQGRAELASISTQLQPQTRQRVLAKALPRGIEAFSLVDRLQVDFEPVAPTAVTVTVTVRDTQGGQYAQRMTVDTHQDTIYLPFSDLKAANVQLNGLKSIEFNTDRPATVMVDDLRLVHSGSGFSLSMPNFGKSISNRQPVWETMVPFLKNTVLLNVWALLFTWLLALPIGIYSGTRPYSLGDKVVGFFAYIGMALPTFFLALLMLYGVSLTYDLSQGNPFHELLPIGGLSSANYHELTTWAQMKDLARHLILPVVVLGTSGMASLVRVLRANFLEVSQMPFVITAHAKGLSARVVNYKHVLRNAITPFIASFGSLLPAMLGGSALVEIIFSYPGIGKLMLEAVRSYDIYLVMANACVGAFLLIIGNLLADILLAWVDPRISYT